MNAGQLGCRDTLTPLDLLDNSTYLLAGRSRKIGQAGTTGQEELQYTMEPQQLAGLPTSRL